MYVFVYESKNVQKYVSSNRFWIQLISPWQSKFRQFSITHYLEDTVFFTRTYFLLNMTVSAFQAFKVKVMSYIHTLHYALEIDLPSLLIQYPVKHKLLLKKHIFFLYWASQTYLHYLRRGVYLTNLNKSLGKIQLY